MRSNKLYFIGCLFIRQAIDFKCSYVNDQNNLKEYFLAFAYPSIDKFQYPYVIYNEYDETVNEYNIDE